MSAIILTDQENREPATGVPLYPDDAHFGPMPSSVPLTRTPVEGVRPPSFFYAKPASQKPDDAQANPDTGTGESRQARPAPGETPFHLRFTGIPHQGTTIPDLDARDWEENRQRAGMVRLEQLIAAYFANAQDATTEADANRWRQRGRMLHECRADILEREVQGHPDTAPHTLAETPIEQEVH